MYKGFQKCPLHKKEDSKHLQTVQTDCILKQLKPPVGSVHDTTFHNFMNKNVTL